MIGDKDLLGVSEDDDSDASSNDDTETNPSALQNKAEVTTIHVE